MNTHMRNALATVTMASLFTAMTIAQGPSSSAETALALTATSANVNGAGEEIEFFINRWSTDADRDTIAKAWTQGGQPAPAARAGAAGQAGRGGAADAPAAGRAGRGGRGGDAAPAAPRTPEGSLATALKDLPAVGYFWTSEVGGYVIRYAYRIPETNGGTRIILVTDKRLGSAKNNWQPVPAATVNNYEFSLIELRLPAKGAKTDGEGKASLTSKLVVDPATKSLVLDGYDTLPLTLQGIKPRSAS